MRHNRQRVALTRRLNRRQRSKTACRRRRAVTEDARSGRTISPQRQQGRTSPLLALVSVCEPRSALARLPPACTPLQFHPAVLPAGGNSQPIVAVRFLMRNVCCAACVFGLALGAVGSLRAGEDKEMRALIAKAIKAMGGEDKLAKYKAVTLKGAGTFYGQGEGLP